MAYDRDGSVLVVHDGTTATQVTGFSAMNDEADTSDYSLPSADSYLVVIFPQLRDLAGYAARFGAAGTYIPQYSTNTTNGIDGTWTNLSTAISNTVFDPHGPSHRLNITSQTQAGIKAIRFAVSGLGADRTVYGVHLYGSISAGQTPDRLIFTDRLGNPLGGAFFDWGDVPQGSSADKLFAIKNLSTTKTASSITISIEALTDTTPSVAGEHLLSLDDTNFTATVNIATLTPGQSQNVALRRVTPSNAVLSVWDARIIAVASTFA